MITGWRSNRSSTGRLRSWQRSISGIIAAAPPGAAEHVAQRTRGNPTRSAPVFRSHRGRARPGRGNRTGVPLSRDEKPLHPALHDVSAYLRGAGTARGYELGIV